MLANSFVSVQKKERIQSADNKFAFSETRILLLDKTNKFIINPNPAQYNVALQFNEILNDASIRIRNNTGQMVKQVALSGSNKTDLDVSTLAAGVYVIEVSSPGNRKIEKLVISR